MSENTREKSSSEDLISLAEAAEISGFTPRHVRHLAQEGKIWAVKIGRNWLTSKTAIVEYLATDRRTGPKSSD